MRARNVFWVAVTILAAGTTFGDTMKGARVEGGILLADGKAFTIDTSTKAGQELAGKTGIFDVSGTVDPATMKIMIDKYSVALVAPEPREKKY